MTRREGIERLELETMLLGRHLAPMRRPRSSVRRLERSGYTLLARIMAQGPMSIGELADGLGLDVSTLNRQTAALRREGYLERVPDPEGGLARKLRVTSAGATQLAADRAANVDGLERVLEAWSSEDVEQLVTLLRRFNTDIEALDGPPWPRS